jgi:hypothetical protein
MAARALGAFTALRPPGQQAAAPEAGFEAVSEPAYATFFDEGLAGGIDLLTAVYPR